MSFASLFRFGGAISGSRNAGAIVPPDGPLARLLSAVAITGYYYEIDTIIGIGFQNQQYRALSFKVLALILLERKSAVTAAKSDAR